MGDEKWALLKALLIAFLKALLDFDDIDDIINNFYSP